MTLKQDLAVDQDRKEDSKLFEKWEQQSEDWRLNAKLKQMLSLLLIFVPKRGLTRPCVLLLRFDLIQKVLKDEDVVHTKLNPFEKNDIRQCLANLLATYRKNDALGVLTTGIETFNFHSNNCNK